MKKIGVGLFLVLLIGGWFGYKALSKNTTEPEITNVQAVKEKVPTQTKTAIPTIFFHGYSGGPSSFGGMIARFEKADIAEQVLQLRVSPSGKITEKGTWTGEKENPLIQVLFEDNKNNEWQQAEWIKSCLTYLSTTYGITKVNLVGHSMGGVSSLRYLESGETADLPEVQKFVAIGAPFNDFLDTSTSQSIKDLMENGPSEISARYQDYQGMIQQLPTTIDFLVMGGQLSKEELTDGTVPLTSALAISGLVTAHGNNVQTEIVTGNNVQHSQLHENKQVDQLIEKFLWAESK
ncbi:alpha/beta fold hydrolase [Enterococcus songbeiensis]|uniref:alpha/beta fold hydrolase n=1 Tax=Enterococcus songbeiensis TaxID=2559927 RepID=UPI0010F914CA|nr:alpha/beta fold hydrolase [Enterococcus songbeiensis]